MPVLQSDDPDIEFDKPASRSHVVLKELRGRSFTVGWAVAVLVATTSWFYFLIKTGWLIVSWFFG
jgi:hypothetical protein